MQTIETSETTLPSPAPSGAPTADDPRIMFYKQMFGGAWITQALGVAAELKIADLLAAAPQTAGEIARQTNTKAEPLYRMLRALAGVGVFEETAEETFSLTPLGELLRSDVPGSQRAFTAMMGAEFHETWGELGYSVRTGLPGFDKRYGRPVFEYLQANPERHAMFDAGMTAIHDAETQPVIDAYGDDWPGFRKVVDVGGGNGLSLAALLKRYPHLQGTVFELPEVAGRARETVEKTGLSGRFEVAEGDFFQAVPGGADAYLLRHIVHDWSDEAATTILRRCREAMAPAGRVLVIESVIPGPNEPHFGKWLDLMMLLIGGRERTAEQYEQLFAAAGLKLNRIIPTTSDVSIVEAVRAE